MNTALALVAVSYDYPAAVAACGFSERTIRDAIKVGDLTAHYKGRRPVILRDDLAAWIESLPTDPTKSAR